MFTVTYSDGNSSVVTPTSLSPSTWSSTVGTQSCTFSYTEDEVTVSASKSASVVAPWSAISLTGASSRTIVFYNISGSTLYTNSACTSVASTNVKYTNQTFYYKSNTSKPTAQYVYDLGDGVWSSDLPSKDTLNPYTSYLSTLFSSSGYVWSGTKLIIGKTMHMCYDLSSGIWTNKGKSNSFHRADFSTL